MLKFKKKLSFSLLVIIICNAELLSQGVFLKKNSDFVVSSSIKYLKHIDLPDYKYGLSFGMIHKGDFQFNLSYEKTNLYQNSLYENSIWEEYYSTSFTYFIKPNNPIRYALATHIISPIRNNTQISSFSFMINGKFLGSKGTG